MDQLFRNLRLTLLCIVLAMSPACFNRHMFDSTIEMTASPPNPAVFSVGPKAPAKAALVLTEAFCRYEYNTQAGSLAWLYVYHLGDGLCGYAQDITRNAFDEYVTCSSIDEAKDKADVVLIPELVKASKSLGVWAWNENHYMLSVQWTMKDRSAQDILWLTTIDGQGVGPVGRRPTSSNEKALVQSALDDLYRNTTQAFRDSPEIKRQILQSQKVSFGGSSGK